MRTVVLDVLRATSTACAALAAGAVGVWPVGAIEEGLHIKAGAPGTLPTPYRGCDVVLGGERHAVPPPGFDCGNSPLDFTPDRVAGKLVVLSTTNGTQALVRCADWGQVAVAAFINAAAAAQWLTEAETVRIVCAGTQGRLTLEDVACAGLLVERLMQLVGREVTLSDGAWAAVATWEQCERQAEVALTRSRHGQRLAAMGYGADLKWCARVDTLSIVPVLHEGVLVTA